MPRIVQRLKEANGHTSGPHETLLLEAADEIERLQALVEEIERLNSWRIGEIERLRRVLHDEHSKTAYHLD